MKIWACKWLMNVMARLGLVRYSMGHRFFNVLYGIRIKSGEWGRLNRGK